MRYKKERQTRENFKLLTEKDKKYLRYVLEYSRYQSSDIGKFIIEFFTKHNLEKYYGYKLDFRRMIKEELNN